MTTLEGSFERVSMPLDRPFTISRGTTETTENVIVTLSDGDHVGIGAAAPDSYFGENTATVESVLPELLETVEGFSDPMNRDAIERAVQSRLSGNGAAKAAISIALADLAAKRLELPLYRLWGLDPERTPTSSFTIGIDDPDTMAENASDAVENGYSVLKLKLGHGTDRDTEMIGSVREAVSAEDARIRVDANEAWTPREAVEMSHRLADHDVEFIEQPVPASDPEGLRFVYERSPLPIAADESCVTLSDLPRVADRCDIAVIKLMKCGGVREAMKLIHAARAHQLEIMLGCMVASNAAIAAGCHLSPLVDYADLDGSLLLADDPYRGVPMVGGEIDLSAVERNGTGAAPIENDDV